MTPTEALVAQILASIPKAPPNPVPANVTSAKLDPATGLRTVLVAYSGATDIPTQWSTDFDQVLFAKGLNGIVGASVLLITNTSPPTISTMLVKG